MDELGKDNIAFGGVDDGLKESLVADNESVLWHHSVFFNIEVMDRFPSLWDKPSTGAGEEYVRKIASLLSDEFILLMPN